MNNREIHRAGKIIKDIVGKLNIDLTGFTVLTEAGSNYFVFTPIIALMANAKKVFAWTRDSRYGKADGIVAVCNEICRTYKLKPTIQYSINERPAEQVKEADIITNLGFVRPLDKELLANVSKSAVIPLMCEAWELRETDINIEYCKQNGIPVAGTWENAPELKVFDCCGPLAIKMANEAGLEVCQNKIIVWSDDHFGEVIGRSFKNYGASKVIQTVEPDVLYKNATEFDFLFLCDYDEKRPIFGEGGLIDIEKLRRLNPGITIIHLYGSVDNEYIKKHDLCVYPDRKGSASVMTFTLAHLGMTPILNLHAGGLKVGELLKKNIESPLAQKIV